MGDRECQAKRVRQLRLEFGFPRATATAITTAGVTQNEELPGLRITVHGFGDPPLRDGMGSERCGLVRDAYHHRAAVRQQIINAVRDGDAGGVGTEVVIVDQTGDRSQRAPGLRKLPTNSRFLVSTLMMDRPRR